MCMLTISENSSLLRVLSEPILMSRLKFLPSYMYTEIGLGAVRFIVTLHSAVVLHRSCHKPISVARYQLIRPENLHEMIKTQQSVSLIP